MISIMNRFDMKQNFGWFTLSIKSAIGYKDMDQASC